MTRRTINHGSVRSHLDGDSCPFCMRAERVVEGTPETFVPSVVLTAFAVHEHGCPLTRLGKKFGLCTCGAAEMWERNRERMVAIVHGGNPE